MQSFELVHLNTGFSLASRCGTQELVVTSALICRLVSRTKSSSRSLLSHAWVGSLTFQRRPKNGSQHRTFMSTLRPRKPSFVAVVRGHFADSERAFRTDVEPGRRVLSSVTPRQPKLTPSREPKCRHGPHCPNLFRRPLRHNKHGNVYGHDQAICGTAFNLE